MRAWPQTLAQHLLWTAPRIVRRQFGQLLRPFSHLQLNFSNCCTVEMIEHLIVRM